MNIELVYDRNCPNVDETRRRLWQALADQGLPLRWREWDQDDPSCPLYVQQYGSPTVLVDGVDVGGQSSHDGHVSCRLYRDTDGRLNGAPSVDQIVTALVGAGQFVGSSRGWRSSLATVPGIAIAFLPKLACPACWPAYAGVLSAVGLGFLLDDAYLFPMTASFLVIAVGALAWRARHRHGWGPAGIGLVASGIVIGGKFVFGSDLAMYAGIVLLVAASIWNAWPTQRIKRQSGCRSCRSDRELTPSPHTPPIPPRSTS